MGQYYVAIILGNQPDDDETEVIRYWMWPRVVKLTEHSYLKNKCVIAFEQLISPMGVFYKSRVVWAGDYADDEKNGKTNLYSAVNNAKFKPAVSFPEQTVEYRYIVNHTKKQYVDKETQLEYIHPLPLLTSEGNQQGGGDYYGRNAEFCGTWARDVISVETDEPSDKYTELKCDFGY